MNINLIKNQCKKSIIHFEKRVGNLKYIKNSIFVWEGFAFCAMLDLFNIDLIIESGTAGGGSTEMWAKYFNKEIYTIDNLRYYGKKRQNETRKRLSKYKHIKFIEGDAFFDVIKIIKKNSNKRIAIFVDGPKGEQAIFLLKQCLKYPNVIFVALHDQCKKQHYHQMDSMRGVFFYTDANWFLNKYSFLDSNRRDSQVKFMLKEYPAGPGLGFALNNGNNDNQIRLFKDNCKFLILKMNIFVINKKYKLQKKFIDLLSK